MLLKTAEAAELLNISTDQFWRLVDEYGIDYIATGKSRRGWRYTPAVATRRSPESIVFAVVAVVVDEEVEVEVEVEFAAADEPGVAADGAPGRVAARPSAIGPDGERPGASIVGAAVVGGEAVAGHLNWSFTTGVSMDFGPGRFRDADVDGVRDRADLCLDTPTGVAVDDTGCRLDEDGDRHWAFRRQSTFHLIW